MEPSRNKGFKSHVDIDISNVSLHKHSKHNVKLTIFAAAIIFILLMNLGASSGFTNSGFNE